MTAPGDSGPGLDRPFRFLDLAAELRNSIYELTLTHDEQHDPPLHATPALLRTCKQVYSEARNLLYARSTEYVTVKVVAISFRKSTLTILGTAFDSTNQEMAPNLVELRDRFPRHLTEIGTLKWAVQMIRGFHTRVTLGYHGFAIVNLLLYTLANCYRKGKLYLTLEKTSAFHSEALGPWEILWPIAKVRQDVQLHLEGFDVEIEEKILSLREDQNAADVLEFDVVEEWASHISTLKPRQSTSEVSRRTYEQAVQRLQSDFLKYTHSRDFWVRYEQEKFYQARRHNLRDFFE